DYFCYSIDGSGNQSVF
nr:immunoglobulin light chain junction region [Macaca mulatta]MOW27772.1 immunoglobulin light chain junction region [Macaca mulatta]MOW27854.1 immunoglobulin light chain junction region [Macaca mulatta]MOW28102.1 immunoglobulin light chain junction region [Macaca mulatta]MOW28454.1 immunoglobulin light chain junction region [Macaca mulatta]